MGLVNAVHTLLEVAAGRRNLNPADADELHAAIDAEAAPPAQDPDPEPEPVVAPSPPLPPVSNLPEGAPWPS